MKGESRIDGMIKKGVEPQRPIIPLPYLMDVFYEIGPTAHSGMGPIPLDDTHLRAWQDNTGIPLHPWESRAVINGSRQWMAASAVASADPDAPAPWTDAGEPSRGRQVAAGLRAALARGAK